MKKFLIKFIKIIIYLFLVIILFSISYSHKSYMQIILSVLASYILYGFIFKKGFFDDIWWLVIKLFGLAVVTYFLIHINVYGILNTIDETVGVILFFTFAYILFKGLSNTSTEDIKKMQKEREQMEKRLEMDEIKKNIDYLNNKRNRIRTSNNILDEISGDTLSNSKLKHNRRYYDKLSDEIDNLKNKRDELE